MNEHAKDGKTGEITEREKQLLGIMREHPELAEQLEALVAEIAGNEGERSLDDMETNVVERVREIAQKVLTQAAQAQERRLNEQARVEHPDCRRDQKKTLVAHHRRGR